MEVNDWERDGTSCQIVSVGRRLTTNVQDVVE